MAHHRVVRSRAPSTRLIDEETGLSRFRSGGLAVANPARGRRARKNGPVGATRDDRKVTDRTEEKVEGRRRYVDLGCRAVNVAAAALALVLTAPLMLVIALLVKATSSGPVIYTQKRVGIDRRGRAGRPGGECRRQRDTGGRLFTIYKFRTMKQQESPDAKQVWARKGDPRITPVGRVLRKFRLDELPQLFNVLKGDMNLVGPRPEQPEIFQELREELEGYEVRQKVLPGITGWAQINHHYDQCVDDVKKKVELDLEYIHRRSALEDLKIMARTVPVVVKQKGAI